MKFYSTIFLIFGFFIFQNCEPAKQSLSTQDIRLVQNLEEENQKVHDFLMKTEDGMPSVKGLLSSVYSLESSQNAYVAGKAKKMKEDLQAIERKDKEKDYLKYSEFSLNLFQLVRDANLPDVYKFYCPMNKKFWVARKKGVQNPYSPEMRTCGDLIIE
jgi:hypothetical protein